MKYRKKPVVIEAIQWDATMDTWRKFDKFGLTTAKRKPGPMGSESFYITTLEGDMLASKGDYIIKGVAGEFYACKPDIFAQTYEPVEE